MAAAVSWAAGTLWASRSRALPATRAAIVVQLSVGGAVLLAVGAISGEVTGIAPESMSPGSWAAFAYLVLLDSLAGLRTVQLEGTPGMVMAATGLLLEQPDPDDTAIREGIEGNLCRCTGYAMIVDSVHWAARHAGAGIAAACHAAGTARLPRTPVHRCPGISPPHRRALTAPHRPVRRRPGGRRGLRVEPTCPHAGEREVTRGRCPAGSRGEERPDHRGRAGPGSQPPPGRRRRRGRHRGPRHRRSIPDIYPLATGRMLEDTTAIEAQGRRCLPQGCGIRHENQVEAGVPPVGSIRERSSVDLPRGAVRGTKHRRTAPRDRSLLVTSPA